MKNRAAFLTTIFPMEEEYLTNFLDSLKQQTYTEFDVIVINDGYLGFDILKEKYKSLNIIELEYSNTHAKNREYGINYIIDSGYDILIFGDSDDFFKRNRIQVCIRELSKYDIVVNDLSLFNGGVTFSKNYISNRVKTNTEIELEFIKSKNIFGMSNTAIKLDKLNKISFDSKIIAIDWYFFSLLLINGYTAVFTAETETFYRQHGENIIGLKNLTKKSILQCINLKIRQYELLVKIDISYEVLLLEMIELRKEVNDDGVMNLIKKQDIKYPLWWEMK